MSQGELDFGRSERVGAAHYRLMRAVNDVVDAIGLMVAAGACGARTSDLADALAMREHRYLRSEWLLAICDVASPEQRARIVSAFIDWMGLRVEAARKLKPEERLARLEERIARRFGEAGAEIVEENRR